MYHPSGARQAGAQGAELRDARRESDEDWDIDEAQAARRRRPTVSVSLSGAGAVGGGGAFSTPRRSPERRRAVVPFGRRVEETPSLCTAVQHVATALGSRKGAEPLDARLELVKRALLNFSTLADAGRESVIHHCARARGEARAMKPSAARTGWPAPLGAAWRHVAGAEEPARRPLPHGP